MKELKMALLQIKFKSSSTIVDSIKISRAVTYAYSLLYPDKIEDFINDLKSGEKLFSGTFPLTEGGPEFPIPYINDTLNGTLNRCDKIKPLINRKNRVPRFINENRFNEAIQNFLDNNYQGIEYNRLFPYKKDNDTKDNDTKDNGTNQSSFVQTVSEPGIVIYKNPIKSQYEDKWKYNDVFTKELYSYNCGYFVAENADKYTIAAIMLLNDLGLSGRRSTGKGQVEITKIKDTLSTGFKNEGVYILLSSFIPDEDSIKNIDFVKSRYQLKIFQGTSIWGNPIGPIRYFMPGSVFYLRGPIHGKVYDENHGIIPFTPVIKGVTQ